MDGYRSSVWIVSQVVVFILMGNVPNDPMWNDFVTALSKETGRTVQDLNTLGLSDPNILKLWTYYSTNVQALAAQQQQQQQATPASTTPRPLPAVPDLYQPSYSFSSTNVVQDKQSVSGPVTATSGAEGGATDTSALYNQLLSLIKGAGSGPDYASLLQQMAGPAITSGQASPSSTGPSSPTQVSYQSLMNQYLSLTGGTGGASTSTSTSTSTGGQTNYDQLLRQFKTVPSSASVTMSTSTAPSYQALVDQYTAMMLEAAKAGPNAGATSGATTPAETSNSVASTSSASTTSSSSGQTPLTFEEQLKTYFPQFQSLFPSTSGSSQSTSGSVSAPPPTTASQSAQGSSASSSNTQQMIFDALLFGEPSKQAPQSSSASSSSTSSSSASSSSSSASASASASTQTSSGKSTAAKGSPQHSATVTRFLNQLTGNTNGRGNELTNHIGNVFKARASYDMGCRFLPELLDLDLMPTSPINCLHKCPPPYINSQRFGIYCLCCPPGVNRNVADIMSIFKGASYMESPFTVVSR